MDKETVTQKIWQLEAERGIRVLYACESGSRAWGFPSPDSDYDVRLIYAHPPSWYLSIDEQKDTIELPINDVLDIGGWEVRKALQLFRKSNAVIYEWLQSPVVYQTRFDFAGQLFRLAPDYFSPRPALYHYLGLVHRLYEEMGEAPEVKLKRYCYLLRSLLSAMWIREEQIMPPMQLHELLEILPENDPIRQLAHELVQMKRVAVEKTLCPEFLNYTNVSNGKCSVASSLRKLPKQ